MPVAMYCLWFSFHADCLGSCHIGARGLVVIAASGVCLTSSKVTQVPALVVSCIHVARMAWAGCLTHGHGNGIAGALVANMAQLPSARIYSGSVQRRPDFPMKIHHHPGFPDSDIPTSILASTHLQVWESINGSMTTLAGRGGDASVMWSSRNDMIVMASCPGLLWQ